jgi:hypothetical protein
MHACALDGVPDFTLDPLGKALVTLGESSVADHPEASRLLVRARANVVPSDHYQKFAAR